MHYLTVRGTPLRQALTDGSYLLPQNPEVLEMMCFVNHSSTPSCTYDPAHHTLVTQRHLHVGDEITVDYGKYLEPHKYNRRTYAAS